MNFSGDRRLPTDTTLVACPSCRQSMQAQELARHDHGTVRIDLCFDCDAIWFDRLESVQLAPDAVIGLFREIAARKPHVRQSLAQSMKCPRCSGALALTHDLGKAGRFSYYACPSGDGRFTPFFQFLREKQFVRTLSGADLKRVRTQVRQISCSECGAPVDLEKDTACTYCHAPVSYLDPEAVEKAVRMYAEADARVRTGPKPEALADALLRTQFRRPALPDTRGAWQNASAGVDLVAVGIEIIGSLFH